MGAVHSRSSRAAEFDVRELHGIAFRRALRKQDRRLERDAAVLRRRRGGASGSSRRRDGDERPRPTDGSDTGRGTREEDGDSDEGSDDDRVKRERRRVAEEMRALRLECARRDAKARQRREAERERRRADRIELKTAGHSNHGAAENRAANGDEKNKATTSSTKSASERSDENDNGDSATFDELLRMCSTDEAFASHAARRRRERERRREAASGRRSSGETSPRDEENKKKVVEKNASRAPRANDADENSDVASPCDALPFAAAAAAAATAEKRTFLLNPPGASRGGLKKKYEQVKVFRDGDSLFQCAFLAELVLRHEETFLDETDDLVFFDRRDLSAMRHAETVALVLRRGVRALGRAEAEETTFALRAGAAARIAEAHVDVGTDGAPPRATPLPTLRDDFDVDAIDAAVVTAVNGAELLNKNMSLCPPRGAPLDTWRRAMNEVGRRAEAELPEEEADFLLDDEADDSDDSTKDEKHIRRLERQRRFDSAVRNVRRAYADEVARTGVPSSSLEVAALAAHLRRPIAVIRGPSQAPAKDASLSPTTGHSPADTADTAEDSSAWRARCPSETFGAAHARRGRRGFTVFWELAENVPDGLPAGDFSLLLPRREEKDDGKYDGTYASDSCSESFVSEGEDEEGLHGERGLFAHVDVPSRDGFFSESDASDVSSRSVDDLLHGHALRSRRFAKSGFWSDRTPLMSASEGEECDSDAGSLWNSESEASFDFGSGSEIAESFDETHDASSRRAGIAPSFLR